MAVFILKNFDGNDFLMWINAHKGGYLTTEDGAINYTDGKDYWEFGSSPDLHISESGNCWFNAPSTWVTWAFKDDLIEYLKQSEDNAPLGLRVKFESSMGNGEFRFDPSCKVEFTEFSPSKRFTHKVDQLCGLTLSVLTEEQYDTYKDHPLFPVMRIVDRGPGPYITALVPSTGGWYFRKEAEKFLKKGGNE